MGRYGRPDCDMHFYMELLTEKCSSLQVICCQFVASLLLREQKQGIRKNPDLFFQNSGLEINVLLISICFSVVTEKLLTVCNKENSCAIL